MGNIIETRRYNKLNNFLRTKDYNIRELYNWVYIRKPNEVGMFGTTQKTEIPMNYKEFYRKYNYIKDFTGIPPSIIEEIKKDKIKVEKMMEDYKEQINNPTPTSSFGSRKLSKKHKKSRKVPKKVRRVSRKSRKAKRTKKSRV